MPTTATPPKTEGLGEGLSQALNSLHDLLDRLACLRVEASGESPSETLARSWMIEGFAHDALTALAEATDNVLEMKYAAQGGSNSCEEAITEAFNAYLA